MFSIIDGHYSLSVSNSTRMVILGKTGVGKSSLTNTIFGEQLVKIGHTLSSETRSCQAVTKPVNGRDVTLIDSPGFFDTDRSEKEMKVEIVRCITECAPGPHAFLIVLKVERFTEHEQAVITKIKKMFSEEFFQYATVLFTHGDQLPEGETIEDCIKDNVPVRDLVAKCGGRCYVQVKELLKTIDQMVEANGGRCYTNEMLQAVQERIIQEEQLIRQSSGNMSEGEIREEAKNRTVQWLGICLAAVTSVVLFGAFFGLGCFGLITVFFTYNLILFSVN
uniref:AIG1-type G domain-containing protein n=1 Tax=Cyclopterus lumpus TaxID=8103 RepID=A0A8C2XCX2_CYCLU